MRINEFGVHLATEDTAAPEPPQPLRPHVPDLDPRWESVILHCLEHDPEARFASVEDVARALTGELVATTQAPGAGVAPAVTTRVHPVRAWLAVAAMVGVLAAGVWVWRLRAVQPDLSPPASSPTVAKTAPLPARTRTRAAVAVFDFENGTGDPRLDWLRTTSVVIGGYHKDGETLRVDVRFQIPSRARCSLRNARRALGRPGSSP